MLCYILESQPWASHSPVPVGLAFQWKGRVNNHMSEMTTDLINLTKEIVQCDGTGSDSVGDQGYLDKVVSEGPQVEELRPI